MQLAAIHKRPVLPIFAFFLSASYSYACFLRYNDISSVTRKDCKIFGDRVTIFISKLKSDQFRDGAEVVITRSSKPTCPVVVAERYFEAMGDPDGSPFQCYAGLFIPKKALFRLSILLPIHPYKQTERLYFAS